MRKYVAFIGSESEYCREANLAFIKQNIHDGEIEKVYKKSNDLKLAFNYAKRFNYILIVAFVSQLGENPKEVIRLCQQLGYDNVVCCDCFVLSKELIPILFEHGNKINEWKACFMRETTKIRKKKKLKIGNPRWRDFLTHEVQKRGAEANRTKAMENEANIKAYHEITRLLDLDYTFPQIVKELNALNFKTPKGYNWGLNSVHRLYKSFSKDTEQVAND